MIAAPIAYPTESDPYYTVEGVRLLRVTKALECIPRHHLFAWSAKMAAQRAVELYTKLQAGDIDQATFDELFVTERIMKAPFEYRDYKGDIGTVAHQAAYEWALGTRVAELDMDDYILSLIATEERRALSRGEEFSAQLDDVRPYLLSAIAFCELTQPEFQAIGLETIGVNITENYAGRGDAFGCCFSAKNQNREDPTGREVLDMIRQLGDGKTITVTGDWKCANTQSDEWRYQLAAYQNFENLVLADGSFHDVPQGQANCVFWVRPLGATLESGAPDRTRVLVQPSTEREFETFLAARDLYELHNNPTARLRLSRAKIKAKPTDVRDCPF